VIPDNNTLVSWNKNSVSENEIKIWNLPTGELKYTIKPTKKINSYLSNPFKLVTVSPDRKNLITQSENGIQTWEVATGQLKNTVEISNDVLAISPDAQIFTTRVLDSSDINIWRMPSNN
jgi:hypothetical protein